MGNHFLGQNVTRSAVNARGLGILWRSFLLGNRMQSIQTTKHHFVEKSSGLVLGLAVLCRSSRVICSPYPLQTTTVLRRLSEGDFLSNHLARVH